MFTRFSRFRPRPRCCSSRCSASRGNVVNPFSNVISQISPPPPPPSLSLSLSLTLALSLALALALALALPRACTSAPCTSKHGKVVNRFPALAGENSRGLNPRRATRPAPRLTRISRWTRVIFHDADRFTAGTTFRPPADPRGAGRY